MVTYKFVNIVTGMTLCNTSQTLRDVSFSVTPETITSYGFSSESRQDHRVLCQGDVGPGRSICNVS